MAWGQQAYQVWVEANLMIRPLCLKQDQEHDTSQRHICQPSCLPLTLRV